MHSPRYLLAALVASGSTLLSAQESPQRAARDTVIELPAMTVTATRDLREVFRTPTPVSVVDSTTLARRVPSSITDLFVDLPGLDVNGVGPSQSRPIIRGLLGQRILLLEDGIRMNNSRRESDFGEIPSIVGLEALGRVEVVRGPDLGPVWHRRDRRRGESDHPPALVRHHRLQRPWQHRVPLPERRQLAAALRPGERSGRPIQLARVRLVS